MIHSPHRRGNLPHQVSRKIRGTSYCVWLYPGIYLAGYKALVGVAIAFRQEVTGNIKRKRAA